MEPLSGQLECGWTTLSVYAQGGGQRGVWREHRDRK